MNSDIRRRFLQRAYDLMGANRVAIAVPANIVEN